VNKDWKLLGRCREADPDEFFPEKGETTHRAKRVCQRCEVMSVCRAYALENRIKHGVWGGLSAEERGVRSGQIVGSEGAAS
jgi:WhiB family redox-sensing transcriptional regulator